jgi:hypothetical protein
MTEIRTFVFTGPSLSQNMAQEILPHAWIHGPAKCGDILKAIRLSPQRIAIIDGYFEQTASLWHKEILFALSLGIEVYGASSMGALRALELEEYGMKGRGKIFESLKKTACPDDDEVCLAHTEDLSHQTPPMCNIRATLEKAVLTQEGLLSKEDEQLYLQKIKALPYYERSFTELSGETTLINFCISHYVDQKKEDAIELLSYLRETKFSSPKKIQPFVPTLFFYKIFREISATPFEFNYSWLPDAEKNAVLASQRPYFPAQQRLTKLFHLCYDLARTTALIPPTHVAILEWAKKTQLQYPLEISDKTLGEYLGLYDPHSLLHRNTHRLTIQLLKALIGTLERLDLRLQISHYQIFANHFRHQNNLLDEEKTLAWLEAKKLISSPDPLAKFHEFIQYLTPLYYLIDLNNAHHLGVAPSLAAINWLKFTTTPERSLATA